MGVLASYLALIGGAFCLFYKSSVLMPHLSPSWRGGGGYIDLCTEGLKEGAQCNVGLS